ncbi:MAG: hypothetical protein AB7U45_15810 [Desulfamplus sp.]
MNKEPNKKRAYQSLRFKLIAGGILILLIPLISVGVLSMSKTATALTTISERQAHEIAKDLAKFVKEMVESEFIKAKILAEKQIVVMAADAQNREEILDLTNVNHNLHKTVQSMGNNYEAIFVTDSKGNIFSGGVEGKKKDFQSYFDGRAIA